MSVENLHFHEIFKFGSGGGAVFFFLTRATKFKAHTWKSASLRWRHLIFFHIKFVRLTMLVNSVRMGENTINHIVVVLRLLKDGRWLWGASVLWRTNPQLEASLFWFVRPTHAIRLRKLWQATQFHRGKRGENTLVWTNTRPRWPLTSDALQNKLFIGEPLCMQMVNIVI